MSTRVIFFVLLSVLSSVISQDSCDSEHCDDRFTVVSGLTQNDCPSGEYYYEDLSVDGCFPTCSEAITSSTSDCGTKPCPPGFPCTPVSTAPNSKSRCTMDTGSCMIYYVTFGTANTKYLQALWKPKCEKDGSWAPVQCKGEEANGRCFCYDSTGKRIYGEEWSINAQDMTCACSRAREELKKNPANWFISLHCDTNGNYEPLQCQMGQCWCAEPKTGDVISTIVPESMMKELSCYDAKDVGEQYLRQCESHLYAQLMVTNELNTHGMTQLNMDYLKCDGDGTYGTYKIQNGIAYCVWKDNVNLGSWQQVVSPLVGQMTCYCARDSKIYELAGLTLTLICQADGSYQPLQVVNNMYYCVDQDGFPKSGVFVAEPDCNTFQ